MPPTELRIRVRDQLLDLANDRLFAAVTACEERMPMTDIAGIIEGDDLKAEKVGAGHREDVAKVLRARFPRKEIAALSKHLLTREPGFMPCVFIVKLPDGDVDVSVMALRMSAVN